MNIQAVSSYNYNNYNTSMTRAQAPKQNISFSSYQTDYGEPVAELDPELFDFIEKNKKEFMMLLILSAMKLKILKILMG